METRWFKAQGYRNLILALVAVLTGFWASGHANAQSAESKPVENVRHWEIGIFLGTTTSGPAGDIEQAMRQAGFNDSSPGSLFGSGVVEHPFSNTGFGATGTPWLVDIRYKIRSRLAAGLVMSQADIGETLGFRKPDQFLTIPYSVTTIAPIIADHSGILRLGLGPAFYALDGGASKIGFLIDLGLAVPAGKRFFGRGTVQYRHVGSAEIGPFEVAGKGANATFPATRVNYTHWFFGLGGGVRF